MMRACPCVWGRLLLAAMTSHHFWSLGVGYEGAAARSAHAWSCQWVMQWLKYNSQLKMKSPLQRSRVTTDWWPWQTNNWRPSTRFQRRTVLSADADRIASSQTATQVTRPTCPDSSSSGSHGSVPCGVHTRTKPSWPPVASIVDSSFTLRHWTPPSCASMICSSRHSGTCFFDSMKPMTLPFSHPACNIRHHSVISKQVWFV